MKKIVFQVMFLALLMLGFSSAQAWAQKPLKGGWTFNVETPMGTFPFPVTFKANGKGIVAAPSGTLQMAYREKGNAFSLTFEGIGLAPDGGDVTVVLRGIKTDTTTDGKTIIILGTEDPSNSTGFVTLVVPAKGTRNK